MRLTFLSLLAISFSLCHAQTVEVSAPTHMSAKLNKVRLVGKNQDGYVVRFAGNEDLIHIYDNELRLASARTLDFKGADGDIQNIMLNRSGASIFYLHGEKRQTMLMMQPVNSKFIEISKPIAIDTFGDRSDIVDANLHFKNSFDQNYTLFYYPVFGEGKIKSMQMTCLDRAGVVIYKVYAPINRPDKDMEYAKVLIDNAGNSYLIFTAEKDGRDNVYGDEYYIVRLDKATGLQTSYTIKCEKEIFGEPQFELDNVSGNLIFCGFYDLKGDAADAAANGFFYLQYSAADGQLRHSAYNSFPTEFMATLTGRTVDPANNRLFTFNIRKLLLRMDGGAMIAAESVIKDKREVMVAAPSMMGSPYNSYRTINTYSFNDIIAFSIRPDGSIDWNAIMRKKQTSEDDSGFNSSFSFANEKERVHFLYLDEISNTGSVNEYKLSSKGESERVLLFNQEDKDVFVIPKLGKQVSPNELLIPSVRSGNFRLVRVRY